MRLTNQIVFPKREKYKYTTRPKYRGSLEGSEDIPKTQKTAKADMLQKEKRRSCSRECPKKTIQILPEGFEFKEAKGNK